MRNLSADPPPESNSPAESNPLAESAGTRDYYSISQAAAVLGVSRVTIWRWIRADQLPARRLGHRTTRIRREDLEQFLVHSLPARSPSWIVRNVETGEDAASIPTSLSPWRHWLAEPASRHFVQFYEADTFLLDAVAEFIGTGLQAGEAGIVIATPDHHLGLAERLEANGVNVAAARAHDQYLPLDADETLASFLVAGAPDPERFAAVISAILEQAAKGGRPVRAFGEMVAVLATEGSPAAAVRLEELWNTLLQTQTFSLFCGYPMARLGGEALGDFVGSVCREHGSVIPAESYAAFSAEHDRLRAVTLLQQKAASLEGEIAERKRAEERLQVALAAERAARQAAEAALRQRDEFLSTAAHELKTPLTTLSGQAQLAQRRLARDGQLDRESVKQAFELIASRSAKLSRLLAQLLDTSRLQAGKLIVDSQRCDLAVLTAEVVADARAVSDHRAIALTAPDSLEALVDPLRLEQVLTNLLDNAVKYSPEGGPIEVRLSRPMPDAIEISVRDHGLGIPPERREQIFERFYQAHQNGHHSGMGLGLYISRQIVEMHGGEIRAEFPPAGGSRFIVTLPLAVIPPRQLDSRPEAAPGIARVERHVRPELTLAE